MKRVFLLVAVLMLLALPTMSVLAQSDTVIRIEGSDVVNFNPILWTDGGSNAAGQFIWPAIYDVDPLTGEAIPGLTSWEISDDGLTYTFTIRDGAMWSDGTPITANDIKFTYEAIGSDLVESPRKSNIALFESLTVVDDQTLELQLSSVNCTIWSNLAVRLLPAHRFAADFSDVMTNDLNTNPDISGGPYIMEEWQPDEFTRFRANPTYWAGEPQVPFLINKIVPDVATQGQVMMAQEADYDFGYPDEMAQLVGQDFTQSFSYPLFNTPILVMNWADPVNPQPAYDDDGNAVEQTPHPILGDVRVRQAISFGYDKDAILGTLDGEGVRLTSSVIPTLAWAYNNDIAPRPYDPEKAMQLLEEAGWTDQDGDGIRECHGCMYAEEGTPLELEIVYSPLVDLWGNIVLVAQDQLSQLGMTVTATNVEWGTFLNEYIVAQKYDMAVVGFGGGTPPDPDSHARSLFYSKNDVPGSGFNLSSYVNTRVDELIDEGRSVPGCSTDDRAPIYYEMQQITFDEVAIDFVVTPNQVLVYNARIEGLDPGPWGNQGLWNVQDWAIGAN